MNRGRVLRQDGGLRNCLTLIHPESDEFEVYGGIEHCRPWALNHHYLLANGVPTCAHGLYLLGMCPQAASCRKVLDHADLWVPADTGEHSSEGPFLLAHLYDYDDELARDVTAYAGAHGLVVTVNRYGDISDGTDGLGDAWYGHGSTAVRMAVSDDWPMWPVEQAAAVLLRSQPVQWPDENEVSGSA